LKMLEFLLPPPPSSWDKNKESKVLRSISECTVAPIEPVGSEFLAIARRRRHKRTLSEDARIEEALREANEDDNEEYEEEHESKKLLRSDPLKWKEQDHYAVLGITKLRYRATDDDIKRAYRRKVLKHHPDKKANGDDSFFKCIQKAWEVMSDNKKRREWDSCDPTFDDSIPSAKAKGDFFEIYASVFEKEGRFSKTQPVPTLGDAEGVREDVEAFYEFWFNFDSWRTFEMMDEEDTDNVDNREEKRYLERRNKAARTKLKKEDNARLNKLVEQAFKADPRIARFKEEEKYAKDAKKREKEAAALAAAEEAKLKAEAEQKAKEEAEAAEKARIADEKKTREAAKNAVRKEKKTIKRLLRDNNNFLAADADAQAVGNQLVKLDEILEFLDTVGLEKFRARLEEAVPSGVEILDLVLDEEHLHVQDAKASKKDAEAARATTDSKTEKKSADKPAWAPKEIAILIKAVKQYPGGTISRWEKISEYVMDHGGDENETPEAKAKPAASDRAKLQASVQKAVKAVNLNDVPTERATVNTDAVIPPVSAAKSAAAKSAAASKPEAPKPTMAAPPNPNWSTEQQIA
ncbi:hypothetical protein BDK51DRAFT_14471, partial [Blyttiomyces helicus]